jgi:peptidoglycan/LPS O-acetylase OafA/YrhL
MIDQSEKRGLAGTEISANHSAEPNCGTLNTIPLTGLRFFAALGVYIYHFPFVARYPFSIPSFGVGGFACVAFFFTLSGLILTITYRDYKWDNGTYVQYLIKRIARIAPLYYLSLAISIPLFVILSRTVIEDHGLVAVGRWLTLHLFISTWLEPSSAFSLHLNAPVWSLSAEVVFYLLFPFLLLGALKLNRWKYGIAGAFLIILIAYVLKEVFLRQIISGLSDSRIRELTNLFVTNPFLRILEFIAGILLGFTTHLISTQRAKGDRLFAYALIALFASTQLSGYGSYISSYLAILAIIGTSLIISGVANRILSHPTIQLLGRASFALYLIHSPVTLSLQIVSRKLVGVEIPSVFACGVCILLSVVLHSKFENLMRNKIISRFGRKAYIA